MDELVIKAQNIEEDIKEMPLLEKIKYAANLYQEMTQVSGEAIGDMNVYFKAKSWVEMTWRHLVAELKSSQKDELAKRVSEARSCSIGQMFGKEDPQVVDVQLSEQFSASIIFKWSPVIRIEFSRSIQDGFGGKTSESRYYQPWLCEEPCRYRGNAGTAAGRRHRADEKTARGGYPDCQYLCLYRDGEKGIHHDGAEYG